ncbi:MAG: UDP-N-acetylglucosamine--N-acetylmuramyl-(pentapeptide) pyrophosphoryl-undecaprenol N-acetylglucosamine transferase [Acidimicrobiales bacterium]
MSPDRFALVAGGGTGGHVVPALAVARALALKLGPQSVELVGSRRGLDSQLVRGTGLPVTLLPGRGFSRRATPRAVVQNLAAFTQLALAGVLAVVVVVRRRPAVVVAMGGYACVPTAIAAAALGVPLVLVNVDAVPGAANRLVGRFARATAVAFEGTPLPRAVLTGAPVREEVSAVSRPDASARQGARQDLGIPPGRHVVAAVGGSLGARRLNEAVLGLARIWEKRSDVAIYHVVGGRDAKWAGELKAEMSTRELWYQQVAYEERMSLFYQAADVVVCRAGANTVAELTVVGVPAVVVPLPGAPGDHQVANAAVLERAGAAVVVEDSACTPERLVVELDRLVVDPRLMDGMRRAAAELGRPDALSAVVAVVEAQARARREGIRMFTKARRRPRDAQTGRAR